MSTRLVKSKSALSDPGVLRFFTSVRRNTAV
jgi:hypothetical protein